jgi:hypothetical protein
VNPHSMQASSHSTWPILIVIYNLPPWLVAKKFFITLTLLISGKESPTTDNIDMYLQSLVEELGELWQGIPAYDASLDGNNHSHFNLRGVLMWTVSDFPAYGLILGQQMKGYHGSVCCRPLTDAKKVRGPIGDKIVYLGMRKRLPEGYEYDTALPCLLASDILRYATERQQYLDSGGVPYRRDDLVHCTSTKKCSTLYSLPYWKVSDIFEHNQCDYISFILNSLINKIFGLLYHLWANREKSNVQRHDEYVPGREFLHSVSFLM